MLHSGAPDKLVNLTDVDGWMGGRKERRTEGSKIKMKGLNKKNIIK